MALTNPSDAMATTLFVVDDGVMVGILHVNDCLWAGLDWAMK